MLAAFILSPPPPKKLFGCPPQLFFGTRWGRFFFKDFFFSNESQTIQNISLFSYHLISKLVNFTKKSHTSFKPVRKRKHFKPTTSKIFLQRSYFCKDQHFRREKHWNSEN